MRHPFSTAIILTCTTLMLSACGSSNNNDTTDGNNSGTGGATNEDLVWVSGEFKPSSLFKDACIAPRSGSDPFTGEVYSDKSGSLLHEQMWLRAWNHETYLWYDEVEDADPNDFNTAQSYFDVLKTTATTESGADKDNFHFYQDTMSYRERTVAGTASGYGINWQFNNTTPPRDLRVRYTEPNSPAAIAGILRGDRILNVDGEDLIFSDNTTTLNNGLFPQNDNETHTLIVESVLGEQRTITLTSKQVEVEPVQNTQVINHNGTAVGYLQFNTHIAKAQNGLINAITTFKNQNIEELVIDLRYNGGGLLALASQFAYMVAGDINTDNQTFEQTIYNDKTPNSAPTPFYDRVIDYDAGLLTSTDLPSLSLNRIYVLATDSTCSASEAFINGLRGIDIEVILIGSQTCGKPYGFLPTDNCSTTYFTIQFSGVNAKGFGDYADGFKPTPTPNFSTDIKGCMVADDLTRPLGDISEGMLSNALYHIKTGACPTIKKQLSVRVLPQQRTTQGLAITPPNTRLESFFFENKINARIKEPN